LSHADIIMPISYSPVHLLLDALISGCPNRWNGGRSSECSSSYQIVQPGKWNPWVSPNLW